MPMVLTDPNLPGNPIVFANGAFLKLSGYSMDEVLGQQPHFMNGLDTDSDDAARFEEVLRADQDDIVETIQYRKDGTRFIASVLLSAFKDDEGRTINHFLSWLDVTRRDNAEHRLRLLQQAQSALRQSEARLSATFESVPAGLAAIDLDGKAFLANAEYRRFLPNGIVPSCDPERRDRWKAWDDHGRLLDASDYPTARALRGERVVPGQEMIYTDDSGREIWTNVATVPTIGDDGQVTGVVAAISDIDERKRAFAALRDSEAQLAQDLRVSRALEAAAKAMIDSSREEEADEAILDAALKIMDSDAASLQRLDPETGELILFGHVGFHPESAAFWARVTRDSGGTCGQSLNQRQRTVVEDVEEDPVLSQSDDLAAYRRSDIVSVQSTPLVTLGGEFVGMMSTHWKRRHRPGQREFGQFDVLARQAADLIERRATELALRESEAHQRLLLAELQHRVRNTLAVVRSIARRTAENSSDVQEMLAHFQGRLDAFSRVQAALTRNADGRVDLVSRVDDELLAHAAHEGDKVRIEGPQLLLEPRIAERLSLAIHELTTNAVKHGALADGKGRIRIAWKAVDGAGGRELDLSWTESGLDLNGHKMKREGFGMELLRRSLPYDLNGTTRVELKRDGLQFRLKMPLATAAE